MRVCFSSFLSVVYVIASLANAQTAMTSYEPGGYTVIPPSPEVTMRFLAPDPLADQFPDISPWAYCHDNPVNRIDPTGMKVSLEGNMSGDFVEAISTSTNIKYGLTMGQLFPINGDMQSPIDQMILSAVFDNSIDIHIIASNNPLVIGGSFWGSQFTYNDGIEMVTAYQELNMVALKSIESFYGMKSGVAVLHELLESIIGAIEHPGASQPEGHIDNEGNYVTDSLDYLESHKRACDLDSRFIEPIIVNEDGKYMLYKE